MPKYTKRQLRMKELNAKYYAKAEAILKDEKFFEKTQEMQDLCHFPQVFDFCFDGKAYKKIQELMFIATAYRNVFDELDEARKEVK